MRLILMRHADAGKADPSRWPDDGKRPLSKEGRSEHRRVAEALKRAGISFDRLLTSPLTRARETAEITAEVYRARKLIEVADELGDPGDLADLLVRLRACPKDAAVLCVGHEPTLSELASLLIGQPGSAAIDLRKSGVIGLDAAGYPAPGKCSLRYHLRPKLLLRLVGD